MKALIFILGMLIFVGLAEASFPQFTMTELLSNDVINGDNDFGDLLFLAQPYTPSTYTKGVIENFTLQRYDVMIWEANNSIRVKNPAAQEMILVNGSQYYFTLTGQYVMTDMINSTFMANITALQEDENRIFITKGNSTPGFDLIFSKTNFSLVTEEVVSASMEIDDDIETGDYSIEYFINGVKKTKSFEVVENINWTMNTGNLTFNSTIRSGDGKYLGRIEIKNNGNKDVELSVTKSGTGNNLISIPLPQTLYRKNFVFIDLQAQVPTVQLSGNYTIDLNITAGNITRAINIIIVVIDNINPVIEQINFSSANVYVINDISVVATDNNDVVNVTMRYDNVTKSLSKDKNLFTTQVKFDKLSRYVMEFCAYDKDGNKQCQTIDKIFDKVQIIYNSSTAYVMPSVKFGKYSQKKIFTINERITEGVTMTLLDLNTNLIGFNSTNITSTPIVRIVDSKGSIKQFPEVGSITIYEPGPVYLEVRGDSEMNVDGVIRIDMPEQFQEVSDITFKTSFKPYDVPEDFKVAWIEGREVICKVVDTGDLDSSYYDCEVRYPVGINPVDISIPTTVGERDKFKNEALAIQENLDDLKRRSGLYIGTIAFMFVAVFLFALYIYYWFPFVRFQTGSTKTIKTSEGREL